MPIQPVRGLGSVGIVQDTPSVLLPPEAWSDGRNVRFDNESVSKISGHLSILDTGSTNPEHLTYWPRPITQYYVYTDAANIFRIDQAGTATNINRTTGGAYNANGSWHSTLFNGGYTVVLNNTLDIPQVITYAADNSDTNVMNLPNWNYGTTTVTANVLRSFGNVLVAGNLNVTDSGVTIRQPSTVRISTRAAPGGLPATWEPGTGVTTADEFELSTPEPIIDIAEISRGQAIVYTRTSFYSLTVDATASRVRQLNTTYGCRSINCVTTFEGQHFVVGLNDVYTHSGSGSITSVIDGRFRDYLYDNLHPEFSDNIFTSLNAQQDEVWICFPNLIAGATGGRCNEALIWNYRHNTWTKRDLPNILDATEGPSTGGGIASSTFTFAGANTGTTTAGTAEVQRG